MSETMHSGGPVIEGAAYTGGGAEYDPNAPVPYWHQQMELITICVCNGLTLGLIMFRLAVRWARVKTFKMDDWWIMVAGIMVIFPHWSSQIMTNLYGSGLHAENVPDEWIVPAWLWSSGWVGYYIVVSMIKVSIAACLLEILPPVFAALRRGIKVLCFFIVALGVAESCVWVFQCRPFMSNFDYDVIPVHCVDVDAARYAWVGIGVAIDLVLIAIPFAIIRTMTLQRHERVVLYFVFGASLLGSITCLAGIYGIWENREVNAYIDLPWTQTPFLMITNVEVLMYTIGASATVFSRFFISQAAQFESGRSIDDTNVSWRRRLPSDLSDFSNANTLRDEKTLELGSPTSTHMGMSPPTSPMKPGFTYVKCEEISTPGRQPPTRKYSDQHSTHTQSQSTEKPLPSSPRMTVTPFGSKVLSSRPAPPSPGVLNDVGGLGLQLEHGGLAYQPTRRFQEEQARLSPHSTKTETHSAPRMLNRDANQVGSCWSPDSNREGCETFQYNATPMIDSRSSSPPFHGYGPGRGRKNSVLTVRTWGSIDTTISEKKQEDSYHRRSNEFGEGLSLQGSPVSPAGSVWGR